MHLNYFIRIFHEIFTGYEHWIQRDMVFADYNAGGPEYDHSGNHGADYIQQSHE